MASVETIERTADQTANCVALRMLVGPAAFEFIAKKGETACSAYCAPTPNGLVHSLRPDLGVGACCPVRWLSCVHSCVAQGPITHRWFTAFPPEVTPRRVVPVFDCGRTSQSDVSLLVSQSLSLMLQVR